LNLEWILIEILSNGANKVKSVISNNRFCHGFGKGEDDKKMQMKKAASVGDGLFT